MEKIINNRVEVSKGNELTINFKIPTSETEFYKFEKGNKVRFSVYTKNGLDKEPLINKTIVVEEAAEIVSIELSQDDINFSEVINKPIVYWYQIELNGNIILGYDATGAKEFVVYPEGK